MLTSNARETLRSVRWLILDEIHTMVATKRGAHLSRPEIQARCAQDSNTVEDWLTGLAAQRRIVPILVAGEQRWIAAEDAGRYRDALGIPPDPGLGSLAGNFVPAIRDVNGAMWEFCVPSVKNRLRVCDNR